MADKLLPCPFCGLEGEDLDIDSVDSYTLCVICGACDAMGPRKKLQEDAVAAWNRRPGTVRFVDGGPMQPRQIDPDFLDE